MPYVVKKGDRKKGQKPYLIVNQKTGKVVGQSDDLTKANNSIEYRMRAEDIKNRSSRRA